MTPGIFGSLFDFDNNGTMDAVEKGIEFTVLMDILKGSSDDDEDFCNDDDDDDWDDDDNWDDE